MGWCAVGPGGLRRLLVGPCGRAGLTGRRWMRDDPVFNEGAGEEVFEQGRKACADCRASGAGPVVHVDFTSCLP